MKAKNSILILLAAMLFATAGSRAASNEISGLLQKGLFEEEANRNLDAAIQAYQAVVTQTDKDHQFAATAIFRLGECYRKLGRTNEANVQYQRILREFADQPELVKLSQDYVGNGEAVPGQSPRPMLVVKLPVMLDPETQEIEKIRAMIKDSPDLINAYERNGSGEYTPLLTAVGNNEMKLVAFLLDNKADIEAKQKGTGDTPLFLAVQFGNQAMAEFLLGRGANIEANGKAYGNGIANTISGYTPLHQAAEHGYKSLVDVLLAHGAKVNVRNSLGLTPLDLAAQKGFKTIAEVLLAHGGDVAIKDNNGKTALHLVVPPGNKAIAELLLANKADVNAKDAKGETPLHLASSEGQLELARLFLASGAEIDSKAASGRTPLLIALERSQVEMAKLLIKTKSDLNSSDNEGYTPLIMASFRNLPGIAGLLMDNGADVNSQNKFGQSALWYAVAFKNPEMVKLILTHKPKVDAWVQGLTLLQKAILDGQFEIAEMLLNAGADVDAVYSGLNGVGSKGYTPLQYAVWAGNKTAVELLLAHKAKVNLLYPSSDRTPISEAKANQERVKNSSEAGKWDEIVEMLHKAGADEYLQRRSVIRVSRSSSNSHFFRDVFNKGTNDVNRYRLFELVAKVYGFLRSSEGGSFTFGRGKDISELTFPDFTRVRISRLTMGETVMIVDLETALNTGDCSQNMWLEWGDIVEIPMLDHNRNEGWQGFAKSIVDGMNKCVSRKVEIICKGQDKSLVLVPTVVPGNGFNVEEPRFRLHDVVYDANVLFASSDTSRVKVKRVDPDTKKAVEMVFDLGKVDPNSDLWLRDGDVIEIPEKP